jgi:hypothetical protein
VTACRSLSKNIGKINIQPVLNKNSPHAHVQLKFDVLGVVEKLVKNIIHI